MEFKGGDIKGGDYGQVSPLDYSGLKRWYRADKLIYNTRGAASGCIDSGYAPGANMVIAAQVYNSNYGLCFGSGSSGTATFRIPSFDYSFLVDGSPYTVIIVSDWKSAGGGGDPGIYSTFGTNQPYAYYAMSKVNPSTAPRRRSYKGLNTTTTNRLLFDGSVVSPVPSAPVFTTAVPAGALTDICYGYGSATPNSKVMMNNQTYLTSNYLNAPLVPATIESTPALQLGGFAANGTKYWEIIIYDHTGKSKELIDYEMGNIHDLYLKTRYPGIF
jgi:hypothetical protein